MTAKRTCLYLLFLLLCSHHHRATPTEYYVQTSYSIPLKNDRANGHAQEESQTAKNHKKVLNVITIREMY